jgi:hypothetical protein
LFNQEVDNETYKRKLCRVWLDSCGHYCHFGAKCTYAHGVEELRLLPDSSLGISPIVAEPMQPSALVLQHTPQRPGSALSNSPFFMPPSRSASVASTLSIIGPNKSPDDRLLFLPSTELDLDSSFLSSSNMPSAAPSPPLSSMNPIDPISSRSNNITSLKESLNFLSLSGEPSSPPRNSISSVGSTPLTVRLNRAAFPSTPPGANVANASSSNLLFARRPVLRHYLCGRWLEKLVKVLAASAAMLAGEVDVTALLTDMSNWCEGANDGTCECAHGIHEMLLPTREQLDAMVNICIYIYFIHFFCRTYIILSSSFFLLAS